MNVTWNLIHPTNEVTEYTDMLSTVTESTQQSYQAADTTVFLPASRYSCGFIYNYSLRVPEVFRLPGKSKIAGAAIMLLTCDASTNPNDRIGYIHQ